MSRRRRDHRDAANRGRDRTARPAPRAEATWSGRSDIAWAAAVAAVVVPWAVLCLAGVDTERPWNRAVSPFGWRRVALVYVVSTMPLVFLTMRGLVAGVGALRSATGLAFAAAAGIALAWATMVFGSQAETLLSTADGVERFAVRVTWVAALQWPWCLAWAIAWRRPLFDLYGAAPKALAVALAVIAAIGPPLVYTRETIDIQTQVAAKATASHHLWDAWTEVERLCEVGSSSQIDGQSPYAARSRLMQEVSKCVAVTSAPLAGGADDSTIIKHARCHAALNELSDASELLQGPAERNPEAALLLAAVENERGDYARSEALCRAAAKMAEQGDHQDATRLAQRVRALDTLVDSLRRQRRYQQAEAEILAAMAALPPAAAHLHFQLAEHYRMGGRPTEAVDHYREAVRREPAYEGRAAQAIHQLSLDTPSCLLRPGGVSGQ